MVAGAKVTATNIATSVSTHTVTDASGLYNFQFLNLGNYTVTVIAPGLITLRLAPFRLEIDQIAKIDAKLKVGAAATTIKVARKRGRDSEHGKLHAWNQLQRACP